MTTKSKKILSRFTAKSKESTDPFVDHLIAAMKSKEAEAVEAENLEKKYNKLNKDAKKKVGEAQTKKGRAEKEVEKIMNDLETAQDNAARATTALETAQNEEYSTNSMTLEYKGKKDAAKTWVVSVKGVLDQYVKSGGTADSQGGAAVDESEGAFTVDDFLEGGATVDGKENECNV